MKTYIKHTKDKDGRGITLHWTDGAGTGKTPVDLSKIRSMGRRGMDDALRSLTDFTEFSRERIRGVIGLYV